MFFESFTDYHPPKSTVHPRKCAMYLKLLLYLISSTFSFPSSEGAKAGPLSGSGSGSLSGLLLEEIFKHGRMFQHVWNDKVPHLGATDIHLFHGCLWSITIRSNNILNQNIHIVLWLHQVTSINFPCSYLYRYCMANGLMEKLYRNTHWWGHVVF